MRILLVNKFLYPRGGAERAVLALGAALESRGHEVFWFGMENEANAVTGEKVAVVSARDYHAPGLRRFRDAAAMLYSFEAKRQLSRLLVRVRPDLLHVHNIYHQLTPSILDAARTYGVPVIMTVHDYKLVCPRYDLLRHGHPCDACLEEGPQACARFRCAGTWSRSVWLAMESLFHRLRQSYGRVRLFLTPSRFLSQVLLRGGIDAGLLRYVPNFALPEAKGNGPPRPDVFLYAGRLSPEKGLGTLLQATTDLDRGTLILCGQGPMETALREMARHTAPGRVVLRGHLAAESLWREMQAASFTVLPSECFENAPLALLESMALGRACLASRIGGIPELVEDQHSGELVPPGDVAAWRSALGRALAQPRRMHAMGELARRRASRDFGLEQHVRAVENAYAEVLP